MLDWHGGMTYAEQYWEDGRFFVWYNKIIYGGGLCLSGCCWGADIYEERVGVACSVVRIWAFPD